MPANLWLDISLPELAAGCCANKVYALVFDRLHRALKDNGSGVRVLTAFTSSIQNACAIILNEHAQRTRYYFLELDSSQFNLPASERGQPYYVEFWRREISGNFDRAVDLLLETRELVWTGEGIAESELGIIDVSTLAEHQAHASVSYDSENQTLYIAAHLEENGAVQEDAVQVTAVLRDNAGNTVISTTQSTYLPNQPGVFSWDQPGIDLTPDRVYVLEVTILDVDNTPHKTISYLNTWD